MDGQIHTGHTRRLLRHLLDPTKNKAIHRGTMHKIRHTYAKDEEEILAELCGMYAPQNPAIQHETLFYRLYETIFCRVHGTPIVVLSVTMGITKFRTPYAFGSRKRQIKLVRMARLGHARMRADSRIDASGGAASASSLQDNDCINAYRDVETATPSAQDSVVTSEAGVGAFVLKCAWCIALANRSDYGPEQCDCVTCEELAAEDSERVAVQQKLGTVPATERKFQMMPEPEDTTATTEGEKYFLVQGDALSNLLSKTPCPRCLATGVKFQGGTQLGLAKKLQLVQLIVEADKETVS
ncbi:hypothetical protein HPB50_025065 [Hyalomma asiaticum]|uniref:Uncharacterized protein n=1 Tax=Hyalomma asiaticum TaxID=266040 RepID=A0ACB7T9Q1_HYAAI|nr:hypothetical protein HPB50_025065 [Hyalomma asiaticum]